MDCTKVQLELVPYLYGEEIAEQAMMEQHLQECEQCSLQLEEMAAVTDILDQAGRNTLPRIGSKRFLWFVAWAASLLLVLFITKGNPRQKQVQPIAQKKLQKKSPEILELLAENQQYRESLSQAQLLLMQKMEQKLAQKNGMEKEVKRLHEWERAIDGEDMGELMRVYQDFEKNYGKTPLIEPVTARMAEKLFQKKLYRQADRYFEKLLTSTLEPRARGEYLWKKSVCRLHEEDYSQYQKLLGELESDKIYRNYHWKAVKAMADQDFNNYRFLEAFERYQKCQKRGEISQEVAMRMKWIDYHRRDNFYPLVLYVQAQQQGIQTHFSYKLILDQYPDSPLAQYAFRNFLAREKSIAAPPVSNQDQAMLRYLGKLSQNDEHRELAIFAQYQKARLLEKNIQKKQTLKAYQSLMMRAEGQKMLEIARQAMERLDDDRKTF